MGFQHSPDPQLYLRDCFATRNRRAKERKEAEN